jgi:hypothetical protein
MVHYFLSALLSRPPCRRCCLCSQAMNIIGREPIADVAEAARLLDSFQFKTLQCAFPFTRGLSGQLERY